MFLAVLCFAVSRGRLVYRDAQAARASAYACGYMEGQRTILSQYGLDGVKQAAPEQDSCKSERFNAHDYGLGK